MMGMQQGNMQQPQMQQGQWWGMQTAEEMAAYQQWCEERKMAIAQQEEQKQLLEQIQARAEEKKRAMAREAAAKEAKAKRDAMVAQWRMWQSQLAQTEEYTGNMDKYTE